MDRRLRGDAQPAGSTGIGALRVVFFGTPDFAVPTLERMAGDARFNVALAVTQPDRPAGRGRHIEASPVKRAAERLGVPVYQPMNLRHQAAREPLASVGADLFVVAAYGLIFGPKTLAIPRLACINVHASLLPRYRGASPIPAAILSGDTRTGVSLMVMEKGLDTGPVIATSETTIEPNDTTASLTERLALVGADLAVESIPRFAGDELEPRPQPAVGASVVRPLVKADGWLDWSRPALVLERQVRAMWPWPRAWTTVGDAVLQIHTATTAIEAAGTAPGSVLSSEQGLAVACGEGALRLSTVQAAGGRPMTGEALLVGRRVRPGDRLGIAGAPPPPPPLIASAG